MRREFLTVSEHSDESTQPFVSKLKAGLSYNGYKIECLTCAKSIWQRCQLSCNDYKIESERLVRRGNQTYTQDTTNIGQSKVSQQPIAFMSTDTTERGAAHNRNIRQEAASVAANPDSLDFTGDDSDDDDDLILGRKASPDAVVDQGGYYSEEGDWVYDSYSDEEKDALNDWIEKSYQEIWTLKEKFFEGNVAALLTDKHFHMVKSLSVFLQDLILYYREANT